MKNTVTTLQKQKINGDKIIMLTCYDYSTAKLIEQAGIETVLVGDSLGQVVLGYPDTISVTMEDMIHHTAAVSRGLESTFLIADLPFMSYQTSDYDALVNAGRLMKEGHANAVKLEGGVKRRSTIEKIFSAGDDTLQLSSACNHCRKLVADISRNPPANIFRRLVVLVYKIYSAVCARKANIVSLANGTQGNIAPEAVFERCDRKRRTSAKDLPDRSFRKNESVLSGAYQRSYPVPRGDGKSRSVCGKCACKRQNIDLVLIIAHNLLPAGAGALVNKNAPEKRFSYPPEFCKLCIGEFQLYAVPMIWQGVFDRDSRFAARLGYSVFRA